MKFAGRRKGQRLPTRGAPVVDWRVAAAVAILLTGCTSAPQNLFEMDVAIEPGTFAEFNTHMEAGATIQWTWSADAEVPWDLHSHAGRQVQIHQRGTDSAGNGSFTAPSAGTYSLYWNNVGNQTVKLSYEVSGEHAFKSAVPE